VGWLAEWKAQELEKDGRWTKGESCKGKWSGCCIHSIKYSYCNEAVEGESNEQHDAIVW
jgi:hypothetical protein